jgi:hypothetical protein
MSTPDVLSKRLLISMPDGSTWAVPVEIIARNRAKNYAAEFGGDVERSLSEDTAALFAVDPYEAQDWAVNNMDWSDVAAHAVKVADRPPLTAEDFQKGWLSGAKEIA